MKRYPASDSGFKEFQFCIEIFTLHNEMRVREYKQGHPSVMKGTVTTDKIILLSMDRFRIVHALPYSIT